MGCDSFEWSEAAISYFKLPEGIKQELDPNKPVKNWITYREEITMQNCPTCNTPLPENHSAFDLEAIQAYVKASYGWHIFESPKYKEGTTFTLPNGKVALVAASKITYDKGDIDVEAYYGESALPQGSEFKTHIVIKVGDAYFKKTGHGDSYGEVTWDGDLMPVKVREKTVLVFE